MAPKLDALTHINGKRHRALGPRECYSLISSLDLKQYTNISDKKIFGLRFMEHLILNNRNVSHNYFALTMDISEDGNVPIPGQFYKVRCGETMDPLLRRPLSVHRVIRGKGLVSLEILYQITGKGTEWLSRRKKGESLDTIGPFGNGFIIEDDVAELWKNCSYKGVLRIRLKVRSITQ